MTIEVLKTEISSVLSVEGCAAEFYFLLDGNEGMKVKKVDITDEDNTELGNLFISTVNDNVLLNDELSLIPLSSADDRKNAIYEYDLNEIPIELEHLKIITQNDDIENYNARSDDLSELEGILVLLGDSESQLAIYKHQYPVTLLKKGSGFNLVKPNSGNRFSKLDTDILKINSRFEFIRINEKYYIFDIKALEKFFGFHDAVKNVAKKGIENIQEADLVMDCEVFSERLDDIAFSRKLVRSAKGSPVLGVIPNEHIIRFTNVHPALKGRFKYSPNGEQLDLKTKISQNLFLKLLNDDFLQSELTKRFYDSIAKDSVNDEENELVNNQ